MEYLGKRSMSSFLRVGITVIWVMGIAVIVMFSLMTLFFIFFGPPPGISPPHFSIDADFIQMELSGATIKNPKILFLSFMPFGAIMLGLGMAILNQLRKIFATLTEGNPFLLENTRRVRKIGLLIFAGVLVKLIAGTVIGKVIMENVVVPGVIFKIKGNLNLGGVFIGLVMLILAEIFRQGALLKEEQDLTV